MPQGFPCGINYISKELDYLIAELFSNENLDLLITLGCREEFLSEIYPALFKQQNYGRAAVKEHTLLLAAGKFCRTVVVFYSADEHCAHLNLCNPAEVFGLHNRILAAIALKYGSRLKSDRPYGMELSLNEEILALFAVIKIDISVIMVHAESEYEASATRVAFCKLLGLYKIRNPILGALNGEACIGDRKSVV